MATLKLGPLPKLGTVRVTVTLPEPLKEELDLYAVEYSRLHGEAEAATLIPHMLEAFLRSDRGWRSRKVRTRVTEKDAPATAERSTSRTDGPRSDL